MSESDVPRNEKGDHGAIPSFLKDAGVEAAPIQVKADTVIYDAKTPAEFVYFIKSGQIRLFQTGPDGGARLVSILGTGDWLGLTGVGGASVYGMRAVAVSTTLLWRFPTSELERKVAELPPIASELISQLSRRLRQAHEAAARLVFDDCNQRLIKTLVHFSGSAAASPGEQGVVILRITHQELAEAIGAARETVSLALTQLRQQNLLRTGRNRVLFDPAALRAFAERRAQGSRPAPDEPPQSASAQQAGAKP